MNYCQKPAASVFHRAETGRKRDICHTNHETSYTIKHLHVTNCPKSLIGHT